MPVCLSGRWRPSAVAQVVACALPPHSLTQQAAAAALHKLLLVLAVGGPCTRSSSWSSGTQAFAKSRTEVA